MRSIMRLTVIASLTLGAIAIGTFGLIGIYGGGYVDFALSARSFGYIQSSSALLRLYWFHTDDDMYLAPSTSARYQALRRVSDGAVCVRYRHGAPPAVRPFALFWLDTPAQRPAMGTRIRMSGLRTRVHVPVALMLAYPLFAVGRDRWKSCRRPKAGFCQQCGYNLTGNASAVCPECGVPVGAV